MILSIFREIFATTPAEFSSDCGLEETSRRLSAAIGHDDMGQLTGRVSHGRISLTRIVTQQSIPVSVHFAGRMYEANGRTHIVGRFGMCWHQRLMWSFYFGFFSLYASLAIFCVFKGLFGLAFVESGAGLYAVKEILIPLVISVFGLGLIYAFDRFFRRRKRLSKDDLEWLSTKLEKALAG